MLALLRTNQFVLNFLLLFYLLLVRLIYFINPHYDYWEYSGGVAWEFISARGWAEPGFGNMIWAAVVTLIIAISLNILENNHRLSGELNLIPGAMFILLSSIFPSFVVLNPALLAVLPMVYVINELINLYKEPNPAKRLFNIGLGLSLACLFYPTAIWFLVFILVALNIMRAIRLKEILMIISGWSTLFFLVAVCFYWQDSLGDYLQTQLFNSFSWLNWRMNTGYFFQWVPLLVLALIFLIGLMGFSNFQLKKSIQAKKSISLLFFYILFGGLTFLIQPNASIDHLLLLFPGLAYLLTFILIRSRPVTAEVIHLFLLLAVMAYQLVV